ncbi:MAG: sensor histidine kinase [Candidatus Binatia bacterium]
MSDQKGEIQSSPMQAPVQPSQFRHLKRQVRWLQWILVALVGVILLLPSSVFFVSELGHLRANAQHEARHFGRLVAYEVKGSSPNFAALSTVLQKEMEVKAIVSLQLMESGGETLRLGEPGRSFLHTGGRFSFPPSLAPLQELRIEMDHRPLLRQTARVLSIHFVVATILALLIYCLPIQALRRAIEELETTQAQLVHSEKISAIGEIFTSLAHEINNPLGIIIGRVKILLGAAREGQLSQDLVRGLEMINRHGTRIAEIVQGLLIFSRKTSFNLTETDMNRVIREVVTLVEKPFAKQGTRIQTDLDPTLPHIFASPDHLQQVFMNLLNNARDAMPEGGTITLRTYPNGSYLVAEVQDTGTGIPDNLLGRVFEPFFTTKDLGKGTGLGLSVTYGIIKNHGGKIEVESSPGHGSLFRLMLLPIDGTSQ